RVSGQSARRDRGSQFVPWQLVLLARWTREHPARHVRNRQASEHLARSYQSARGLRSDSARRQPARLGTDVAPRSDAVVSTGLRSCHRDFPLSRQPAVRSVTHATLWFWSAISGTALGSVECGRAGWWW